MSAPASHLDLLAVARAVQRAAVEDDVDALDLELCRFRSALVEHLHAEHRVFARLSDQAQQVIGQGQQRLLRLVDELLVASGDGSDCGCLVRAAELRSALARQARLEVHLRAGPITPSARSPSSAG